MSHHDDVISSAVGSANRQPAALCVFASLDANDPRQRRTRRIVQSSARNAADAEVGEGGDSLAPSSLIVGVPPEPAQVVEIVERHIGGDSVGLDRSRGDVGALGLERFDLGDELGWRVLAVGRHELKGQGAEAGLDPRQCQTIGPMWWHGQCRLDASGALPVRACAVQHHRYLLLDDLGAHLGGLPRLTRLVVAVEALLAGRLATVAPLERAIADVAPQRAAVAQRVDAMGRMVTRPGASPALGVSSPTSLADPR
jgi:hypothetical protein